jgi:hypothetical protein
VPPRPSAASPSHTANNKPQSSTINLPCTSPIFVVDRNRSRMNETEVMLWRLRSLKLPRMAFGFFSRVHHELLNVRSERHACIGSSSRLLSCEKLTLLARSGDGVLRLREIERYPRPRVTALAAAPAHLCPKQGEFSIGDSSENNSSRSFVDAGH